MFSYYGSKSKIIHHYPPPKYGRIIEPFAGSAQYALKYPENDVLLVDRYQIIVDIWKWIIQATEKDIQSLPVLKRGDDLREITYLSDPERYLLGFSVSRGSYYPKNIVTKMSDGSWTGERTEIERMKDRILRHLPRIQHWKVFCSSYEKIKFNPQATWFIDPPYQEGMAEKRGGYLYVHSSIDFENLADFCLSRKGLVIACDGAKSNWLPFSPLYNGKSGSSINRKRTEGVWISDDGLDSEQPDR